MDGILRLLLKGIVIALCLGYVVCAQAPLREVGPFRVELVRTGLVTDYLDTAKWIDKGNKRLLIEFRITHLQGRPLLPGTIVFGPLVVNGKSDLPMAITVTSPLKWYKGKHIDDPSRWIYEYLLAPVSAGAVKIRVKVKDVVGDKSFVVDFPIEIL